MNKITAKLTVFFENPFWIGLYEREENGRYEVCKITFGAEPKDYEVYDFMLKNLHKLKFTPSLSAESNVHRHSNPKRIQREINRQIHSAGIGTKAQQALKLMREEGKISGKIRSREEKEREKEHKFALHTQKRKAKHKGH